MANNAYLVADHKLLQSIQTSTDAEMDNKQLIKEQHTTIYCLLVHIYMYMDINRLNSYKVYNTS